MQICELSNSAWTWYASGGAMDRPALAWEREHKAKVQAVDG